MSDPSNNGATSIGNAYFPSTGHQNRAQEPTKDFWDAGPYVMKKYTHPYN